MGWHRRGSGRLARAVVGAAALSGGLLAAVSATAVSPPAGASGSGGGAVLLVGTFHGHKGQYTSIQAAVNAAKPGDWILIAPGDYHEDDTVANPPTKTASSAGNFAGVLIHTPTLHLRGMTRSKTVVDGTKAGSPECSAKKANQDFGTKSGRNGIVVFETDGVSIQNLTVCNFLAGTGSSGNQIWWNGGSGTGKIGLHHYTGQYITATSSFFNGGSTLKQGEHTAAAYGIFSSNSSQGEWNQIYASDMNDSGMYVGACQQQCTMVINHAWMEDSALGYSGTNSGGQFVIENSKFDDNEDGFDTNTQISGDPPAPQNGACPNTGISPITHTHSCWVFMHNVSDDNNNANVPAAGYASNGPTGTGMSISGAHNDTIMDNTFATDGAWGTVFVPFPTSATPTLGQVCATVTGVQTEVFGCVFDPEGDALIGNTYKHDGFFGNATNGDYAQITLDSGQPTDCFSSNKAPQGSYPTNLEQEYPKCGGTSTHPTNTSKLVGQVLCDAQFAKCTATQKYPQHTGVKLKALPKTLPTMPNPCKGVPANPWCKS